MRILHLVDFFSPLGGGLVDVAVKLSRGMAQRGHEVVIYTSDYKLDRDYLASFPEVNVKPFRCLSGAANFYVNPTVVRVTRRDLKGFDIVHMHCYRSFQNIVVGHYAVRYGVPFVLQAHGTVATYFYKGLLKRLYDKMWGYGILRNACMVIASTEAEAGQYRDMGVDDGRIEIIPNGISLSEYEDMPPAGEFRRKYGLGPDTKIILFLARIHEIKGPDLLVKAFAAMAKARQDAVLVIAGPDDGYLAEVRRLTGELQCGEKVFFTGPLYGNDKKAAYADADIYVLPSRYELFGITVLEAMACGTPVVMTDRCSLAGEIDAKGGVVVPFDAGQLGAALLRLLEDDAARQALGAAGRQMVLERYNLSGIVEQVEHVYTACLAQGRCE